MYLLDTNVISEHRKAPAGKADANLVEWMASHPAAVLFISVVSIKEIELGVALLERRDGPQGEILRSWFERRVLPAFADGRILPVTLEIARRCCKLHVPNPRPELDAFIAATALVHNLTVVSRNTADFALLGVKLLNPWEPQ